MRHPFRPSLVRRVSVRREEVEAFVFWTRNPVPFLPVLDVVLERGDPFYFLITLTGYPPPLETATPDVETARAFFQDLCRRLGRERLVWRYDPLVFTAEMDLAFHKKQFGYLARTIGPWCRRVIVSFQDSYARAERRLRCANVACLQAEERPEWAAEILSFIAACAREQGLEVQSCAERLDTAASGVTPGKCILK